MKTVFAATIVSALLSSVAAQSSNPLPPGTPGMCFKQKRFHSIPALNLQIPLNIYQNGQNVDASLRYAMSKISLPPQSGNLMKDCLDTHNVFRILSGVTPLTWSFSAQAVAQNWANKLASSGAFEHSHTPGYGENLYRESGMLKASFPHLRTHVLILLLSPSHTNRHVQLLPIGYKELVRRVSHLRIEFTYWIWRFRRIRYVHFHLSLLSQI